MSTAEAIAERLKDLGHTTLTSGIWSEVDSDSKNLIWRNRFTFLIAVAFDRGMPWQIPAEMERMGYLDHERLACMTEAELIELLEKLTNCLRWGTRQGVRTLSDGARLVCERFDGDAGAFWKSSSPAEVEKTLQEIHRMGAGIASIATRILHDDFGCFIGQEWQIDVKPDRLLLRVFRRAGLIDDESEDQARRAARRLNPEFPGALDLPAWRIGQLWCQSNEPECVCCPLTRLCAKRIQAFPAMTSSETAPAPRTSSPSEANRSEHMTKRQPISALLESETCCLSTTWFFKIANVVPSSPMTVTEEALSSPFVGHAGLNNMFIPQTKTYSKKLGPGLIHRPYLSVRFGSPRALGHPAQPQRPLPRPAPALGRVRASGRRLPSGLRAAAAPRPHAARPRRSHRRLTPRPPPGRHRGPGQGRHRHRPAGLPAARANSLPGLASAAVGKLL